MGDVVVEFSHKCDYPPDAVHRPKMIEPVFDISELDSRRIEELAREYSKHGGRLYRIKLEMLKKENSDMPCESS